MSELFKSETLIITGGLGDIGRAIALEFARQGADVALSDILPASVADGFISSLKQEFKVRAIYNQVDTAEPEAVRDWIMHVESEIGVPGIIVANAAIATIANIRDMTPVQWASELNVNLNGAFYFTQFAAGRLLFHKLAGRIVFIGSWAAHAVHVNVPAYSVSKAGLRMLCKCMAMELAPYNILVNEIAPGYVDAGLSGKIFRENPDTKKEAIEKVPVRKLITPSDVALQVLQLCNPANQHMTGATIVLDGGLSMRS